MSKSSSTSTAAVTRKVNRIAADKKRPKSERIRELADLKLSIGDIARAMGIRYQHAWNVLHAEG